MINFIDIATEQTTAATDLVIAILAVWAAWKVFHNGYPVSPLKARIWIWIFVLLAFGALLGAIAHGIQMDGNMNFLIWQPLNLSLGLSISLFAAAAILDWREGSLQKGIVPVLLTMGFVFYLTTVFIPGSFLVFIIYEAVIMLFALTVYIILAIRQRIEGSWWVVFGILLSIIAAVIQATETLKFTVIWEFDHNGIFHLVQILGIVFLVKGLINSFKFSEQ